MMKQQNGDIELTFKKSAHFWLDSGLNGLFVDQACAAGVDYVDLRRTYGPSLALMGGIDYRTLYQSDEALYRELERKIPPLLQSGRYFPGFDDTIRATIPFNRFMKYRERLLELVERG